MIALLARLFIKDRKNTGDPRVRRAYGSIAAASGIALNLLLCAGKLIAGMLSASIAITADALNNLSDAGSSIIAFFGFKLSGKRPDTTHPFGHGRFEYISGLVVSFLILLMGFELGKSSIEKIINQTPIEFRPVIAAILIVSIAVKLYMAVDGRRWGKRLASPTVSVTATDSLSDTISTTVVLISAIVAKYTGVNIDGWCGCAVACFIIYSGIVAAKDTIGPLLGQPPSKELVSRIEEIVKSHDEVIGVHDLLVHDYGPGRMVISLHVEVSAADDFLATHDVVDNIERELSTEIGCVAVIHMDPIEVDDELTAQTRRKVEELLLITFDNRISIHDFRMVTGPTHTNVIFDITVPFDMKMSEHEVKDKASRLVRSLDGNYFAVVTVDIQ